MKNERIVLIGAGNVAVHLGKALFKAGFDISQVYSRTMESAKPLADELDAEPITNLDLVDGIATVLIFAINDIAIKPVLEKLHLKDNQLLIHTSGSVNIDVFKGNAAKYGVLYPLQTFSKFRQINFFDVPVFIEANSKDNLSRIMNIAKSISSNVNIADSAQRQVLHISGVFMNNFANFCYTMGNHLASNYGCRYGFEIFKPLILETALKAIESGNPKMCQTGPALRNNKEIVAKHFELLQKTPEIQNLYTFVTNSIGKFYNNETLI
jgi:predicted short-subunit dehydrogenase-like oxidoreductase (DUF2520 family)